MLPPAQPPSEAPDVLICIPPVRRVVSWRRLLRVRQIQPRLLPLLPLLPHRLGRLPGLPHELGRRQQRRGRRRDGRGGRARLGRSLLRLDAHGAHRHGRLVLILQEPGKIAQAAVNKSRWRAQSDAGPGSVTAHVSRPGGCAYRSNSASESSSSRAIAAWISHQQRFRMATFQSCAFTITLAQGVVVSFACHGVVNRQSPLMKATRPGTCSKSSSRGLISSCLYDC